MNGEGAKLFYRDDLWTGPTHRGEVQLSIDVSINGGKQVVGFHLYYKTKDRNNVFDVSNYEELSLFLKRKFTYT